MAKTVSASEFRKNMREYLNQLVYKGESFVIKRHTETIARVEPYRQTPPPKPPTNDSRS